MIKKMYIYFRTSIKLISLIVIASIVIFGTIAFVYKPIYSVTLNGEHIGYSADKSALQKRINNYMENGEEDNVAFVEIEELPQYKLCLLKKGIVANDDEIFNMIKETGTVYYNYYAILESGKEKVYVSDMENAKQVIEKLKSKKSTNSSKLTILEKYETTKPEFLTVEKAVSKLYQKPVVKVATTSYYSSGSSSGFSTRININNTKVNLGISLIKPISGVITSRYGSRWGSVHTGLDVATSSGTPIKAAAAGTVTYAGWKGSYGNLVVLSHGNGIQTYYAHCSKLLVSAGTKVSQGQVIARVGSTGNSTGPHLHIEIRKNGSTLNPQNYLTY